MGGGQLGLNPSQGLLVLDGWSCIHSVGCDTAGLREFFVVSKCQQGYTRKGSRLPSLDKNWEKQVGVLHCHLSVLLYVCGVGKEKKH